MAKKELPSNYKIKVEHDKDSQKTLEDIKKSNEFKEIVKKIIINEGGE